MELVLVCEEIDGAEKTGKEDMPVTLGYPPGVSD